MTDSRVKSTLDDKDAVFNNFVNVSYKKLHRYALSLLPASAADVADDLVQEAYSRVLESIRRGTPSFAYFEYRNIYGSESFDIMRYMHVVVKHIFLDMVQHRHSGSIPFGDLAVEGDMILDVEDLDEYSNVEKFVLRQESSAELSSYVDGLPQRMRSVMKLKLMGYSSREIADKLSMSSGAVRVSAVRATRRLREVIVESPRVFHAREQQGFAASNKVSPVVLRNITRLPGVYQKVVALRDIRSMTYREIAHQLSRKVSTVKSQYRRGKEMLRSLGHDSTLQEGVTRKRTESNLARSEYVCRLSETQQQIVDLHCIQGMSYTMIAARLGIAKGTVKSHMSRAMQFLRQCVDSQGVSPAKTSRCKGSSLAVDAFAYIEMLSSPYRFPFREYYVKQRTARQIAVELGRSPEAIESTVKRARLQMDEEIDRWRKDGERQLSS